MIKLFLLAGVSILALIIGAGTGYTLTRNEGTTQDQTQRFEVQTRETLDSSGTIIIVTKDKRTGTCYVIVRSSNSSNGGITLTEDPKACD